MYAEKSWCYKNVFDENSFAEKRYEISEIYL